METDFAGGMERDKEEMNEQITSRTTLGCVGLPTDIENIVAFLCADCTYLITAQRI